MPRIPSRGVCNHPFKATNVCNILLINIYLYACLHYSSVYCTSCIEGRPKAPAVTLQLTSFAQGWVGPRGLRGP